MVLEKTLESPLDCKEIQPVHSKGDQSWGFIGRTDAKAETPLLWPPGAKSWLIGKDPDAGRDWGQEEKGTTEDEMAGWHQLTRWTWVWVNSGSWWWTGRPGVLRFMGSQTVGHDLGLNWTELNCSNLHNATHGIPFPQKKMTWPLKDSILFANNSLSHNSVHENLTSCTNFFEYLAAY